MLRTKLWVHSGKSTVDNDCRSYISIFDQGKGMILIGYDSI